jgi:hypothetical protein
LQSVAEKLRPDVAVGAQDVWSKGNGAFTGETSADMLKVRKPPTKCKLSFNRLTSLLFLNIEGYGRLVDHCWSLGAPG